MPELSLTQLRFLATKTDTEVYVGKVDGEPDDKLIPQFGWFGARLVRNLKVSLNTEDRAIRQQQYGQAKDTVERALIAAYGVHIGTQAYRSGIGKFDTDGNWSTDNNFPISRPARRKDAP